MEWLRVSKDEFRALPIYRKRPLGASLGALAPPRCQFSRRRNAAWRRVAEVLSGVYRGHDRHESAYQLGLPKHEQRAPESVDPYQLDRLPRRLEPSCDRPAGSVLVRHLRCASLAGRWLLIDEIRTGPATPASALNAAPSLGLKSDVFAPQLPPPDGVYV